MAEQEEKRNWFNFIFRFWGLAIFLLLFYEWFYDMRFVVLHFPLVVASIAWIIMQVLILIKNGDER